MDNKYYIGYEYTTAAGYTMRKLVICDTYREFLRVRAKIREAKYEPLYFDGVFNSQGVPEN